MISNFASKLINEFGKLKKHPALRKFIKHNQRIFPNETDMSQRKSLVLVELNNMHSAHIAYSYIANTLAQSSRSKIQAYVTRTNRGILQRIIFKLRTVLELNENCVYKSFGACEFIQTVPSPNQKVTAVNLFQKVFEGLHTKQDIENVTINGVWVGDLFYDTFLMTYKKPTIDKESTEFKRSLLESIELFVFWEAYLSNNDVRAIVVSHCVYNLAIPLRIAVQRNIPAFQANLAYVYRLSSKNLFAYKDFFHFRERFAALPLEVQEAGIEEAQRRIERRLAGEVGVDMAYSSKSAYGAVHYSRLLKESPRIKLLVATHCFFDSQHSFGNNIFPDFYEWLDFLGKMTEATDYDWYIKTHPDYLQGTKEIIDYFVAKYPKFTLLPADASHHQIIAEGINFALTVYGSIGFEYAALGIPVINASQNNPHIAYDFNLHARDIEDYRRLLTGLNQLEFAIDKQQVFEYYFMQYVYNSEDIFFNDYDRAIAELGGYSEQFTPAIYEKWLNEWSPAKHSSLISALHSFLQSGDSRMNRSHYGPEVTVDRLRLE